MSDVLAAIGICVAIIATIFGLIFGIDRLIANSETKACANKSEVYGYPTKYYGTGQGCVMDINGQKIKIAVD